MSKPTQSMPQDVAAYAADLAAWKRRLAEALGLDPEAVLDIDADPDQGVPQSITWKSLDDTGLPDARMSIESDGASDDGNGLRFSFEYPIRTYDEAKRVHDAAGDKPQMFTPEAEARLRARLNAPDMRSDQPPRVVHSVPVTTDVGRYGPAFIGCVLDLYSDGSVRWRDFHQDGSATNF